MILFYVVIHHITIEFLPLLKLFLKIFFYLRQLHATPHYSVIVGDAYVTLCVTVGCDACDAGGDKGVCSVCDIKKKNDFSQLGGTVVIDCVGIIQQILM